MDWVTFICYINKKYCIPYLFLIPTNKIVWPKSRNAVKCCEMFPNYFIPSVFGLLTTLSVQLLELKVIKQTILVQNHWGEQAQKFDSASPCRQ